MNTINKNDNAPVRNASNPKEVKEAKRRSKIQRSKELSDIQAVLSTESGRRLLWRMMGRFGLFESPYNHSGSITNLNIGRSEAARWLLSEIISVDPDLWIKMQQENLRQGEVNV